MGLGSWIGVAALMVAIVLTGCGHGCDEDRGSACVGFAACGGDLVGRWAPEGACGLPEPMRPGCPAATIASAVDSGGELRFDGDGAYAVYRSRIGSVVVTYPPSCMRASRVRSCAELEPEVSPPCAGDPEVSCRCVRTVDEARRESGTYAIRGSSVELDDGTTRTTLEYCVVGDVLRLRPPGETGYQVLAR